MATEELRPHMSGGELQHQVTNTMNLTIGTKINHNLVNTSHVIFVIRATSARGRACRRTSITRQNVWVVSIVENITIVN